MPFRLVRGLGLLRSEGEFFLPGRVLYDHLQVVGRRTVFPKRHFKRVNRLLRGNVEILPPDVVPVASAGRPYPPRGEFTVGILVAYVKEFVAVRPDVVVVVLGVVKFESRVVRVPRVCVVVVPQHVGWLHVAELYPVLVDLGVLTAEV